MERERVCMDSMQNVLDPMFRIRLNKVIESFDRLLIGNIQ
jgi:hypothetical protein